VARHVVFESERIRPADLHAVREALWEAASWVDCAEVKIERVTPGTHHSPLHATLLQA